MVFDTIVDTTTNIKGWSIYQPNIGFNVVVLKFGGGRGGGVKF
jgi:hypothetical protein